MLPTICHSITNLSVTAIDRSLQHSTIDQNIQLPSINTNAHVADHDCDDENIFEEDLVEYSSNSNDDNCKTMSSSCQQYLRKCKARSLSPARCIKDFLQSKSNSLKLEERSIDVSQLAVLFHVLKSHKNISLINLKGTNIPATSLSTLWQLLGKNHHITDLNLSHNVLHGKGAMTLKKALGATMISRLNLQSTGLDDLDLENLKEAFTSSTTLLKLIISHNKFGERSGTTFGYILQNNSVLEKLNVNWNCIRRSGTCALSKGLKHNGKLLYLKVAFNGFGNEGATELGNALAENVVLVCLDVKHNRITNDGAISLSRGLFVNDTLKELDVSGNLITSDGAQHILRSVMKTQTLCVLYMGRLSPDRLCMDAITYLQRKCPNMVITYGASCSSTVHTSSRKFIVQKDIFNAIREYLSKKRLRMLDLFMKWDKSRLGYLTYDELVNGLVSCCITITKKMLEDLFHKLDEDNDGAIEYREFVAIAKLE